MTLVHTKFSGVFNSHFLSAHCITAGRVFQPVGTVMTASCHSQSSNGGAGVVVFHIPYVRMVAREYREYAKLLYPSQMLIFAHPTL